MSTLSPHRLSPFERLKKSTPKTRWLDRLFLTIQFWNDHQRLPRQFGGSLSDAWFYIKRSKAILDPVRAFVTDKVLLKEYVTAKLGAIHNVRTIAVLDSFGAARRYEYPENCVIKPTHMPGEVIMRRGGSPVDFDTVRRWFHSNYYDTSREANYRYLRRRVIVEPFIFDRDNVEEFKIFCLHGRPLVVQVDFDRYTNPTQNLYTPNWEPLPFAVGCPLGPGFPRPRNLPLLLHYAGRLGEEFSLVRIDLYTDGQHTLVGGITNIPQSGSGRFVPSEGEAVMGRLFFGDSGFQPMQLESPPSRAFVVEDGVAWSTLGRRSGAMIFNIVHTTAYEYSAPAIESFTELRVRPRQSNRQIVHRHVTEVTPRAALEDFTDYYDNAVECLSVPYRHKTLTVTSRSTVETLPHKDALSALDLSVSEAVRLNWPQRRELFDFLMPSRHSPITPELEAMSKELLPSSAPYAESMFGLNKHIFEKFTYMPGVTDVRTPLSEVLRKRQGVCQDFAHLMIALVRCAGLPARYVSGYLETDSVQGENGLVGATASHAWVEVYLPNGVWVGLDPTNDMLEGERHVQIGIGRDYGDVPPLRGVFKGARRQALTVGVTVSRTTGQTVEN